MNNSEDNLNLIDRLLKYLNIESIDILRKKDIDHKLICDVANFLLHSNETITFVKVANILDINRASIYNTHGKATDYIKSLIIQQKALKHSVLSKNNVDKSKKKSTTSNPNQLLDNEKIEKFMTVIMSLEYQKQCQNKTINQLRAEINSLKSTITQLKLEDNL